MTTFSTNKPILHTSKGEQCTFNDGKPKALQLWLHGNETFVKLYVPKAKERLYVPVKPFGDDGNAITFDFDRKPISLATEMTSAKAPKAEKPQAPETSDLDRLLGDAPSKPKATTRRRTNKKTDKAPSKVEALVAAMKATGASDDAIKAFLATIG